MRSAILLLAFNRPEPTRRIMETIRAARPPRLYVAADGPRAGRPGEAERCAEVRAIATRVDWPCEVRTLFRESNLGCKRAVSGGISWFFEHEVEGVIIEDDVLTSPSFFAYCDEMLERYRDDRRVMHISADYFPGGDLALPASYAFSRYVHIWGWASWRRAWGLYDVEMKSLPAFRATGLHAQIGGPRQQRAYWTKVFDAVHAGAIDTWDYQWQYCCLTNAGLAAVPTVNLARNIGFDRDATHTHSAPAWVEALQLGDLRFPLQHPADVRRCEALDEWEDVHLFRTRKSPLRLAVESTSANIRRVAAAFRRRLPI